MPELATEVAGHVPDDGGQRAMTSGRNPCRRSDLLPMYPVRTRSRAAVQHRSSAPPHDLAGRSPGVVGGDPTIVEAPTPLGFRLTDHAIALARHAAPLTWPV